MRSKSSRFALGWVLFASIFGPTLAFAPAAARAQPTAAVPSVVPPSVKTEVAPVYPSAALSEGARAVVILEVTVGSDGAVTDVQVFQSGGELFDTAAVTALWSWTFEPAKRAGEGVASRIHIPIRFEPPAVAAAPGQVNAPQPSSLQQPASVSSEPAPPQPAPQSPQAVPPLRSDSPQQPAPPEPAPSVQPGSPQSAPPVPPASPQQAALQQPEPQQREPHEPESQSPEPTFGATAAAVATDAHRHPPRAASDFVMTREVIAVAPHADVGSVLRTAPGIYVSRPEGDAVAHEIYLRGFDAEHGQDIALSAAGIPINQPSHLHGQGYADLNFIPPEVIRAVRVTEGVYDPHQGDFAVAGSVDFDLGVEEAERGVRSTTSIGSFGASGSYCSGPRAAKTQKRSALRRCRERTGLARTAAR